MSEHTNRRAVVYARKSTAETDRQVRSLEDQIAVIEEWAVENDCTIVRAPYLDSASGTDMDRPGLQQMLSDARSDERDFDTILIYDISRFGRFGSDYIAYLEVQLREVGVEVIYTAENLPEGFAGKLMKGVRGAMAEEYSASLSKTIMRGMLRAAQEGKLNGRAAPYGYDFGDYEIASGKLVRQIRYTATRVERPAKGGKARSATKWSKETVLQDTEFFARIGDAAFDKNALRMLVVRRLVPSVPERVAAVRRIFDLVTNGVGPKAVAEMLNRDGVLSPASVAWSSAGVRNVLENVVYKGFLSWGRRKRGKFHSIENGKQVERPAGDRGRRALRGNDTAIISEHTHDPLVTPKAWDAAQAAIQVNRRKRVGHRGQRSPYLLSGLTSCVLCGRGASGQSRTAKGGRYRYYVCNTRHMKGSSVCASVPAGCAAIEDAVLAELNGYLAEYLGEESEAELEAAIRKEAAKVTGRGTPVPVDYDTKIESLAARIASHPDIADLLIPQLERLKQERDAVAADGAGAPVRLEEERLVRDALEMATDMRRLLSSPDIAARKLALRHLIDDIAFDGRLGEAVVSFVPIAAESASPQDRDAQVGEFSKAAGSNDFGNSPTGWCRRRDSNPQSRKGAAF